MPRSGVNGTYTLPPNTDNQQPLTTISSSMFNAAMDDVEQTFNSVQPEAYGGTGADNFADARENMGLAIGTDVSAIQRGHLFGLRLSNNVTDATNDIDIAVGEASSDAAPPVSMTLSSALTKRLDAAWAVGNNQGGRDTGSIADGTWHVWLIQRSDTGVVDALFSLSATAPTMPTNYDRKRRIGSILRASGAITAFVQIGDRFLLSTTAAEVITSNPGTSAVLAALRVPTGLNVTAVFTSRVSNASLALGNVSLYLSSPLVTDEAAGTARSSQTVRTPSGGTPFDTAGQYEIITDTSGRIRYRFNGTDAQLEIRLMTVGWIDTRGRD